MEKRVQLTVKSGVVYTGTLLETFFVDEDYPMMRSGWYHRVRFDEGGVGLVSIDDGDLQEIDE